MSVEIKDHESHLKPWSEMWLTLEILHLLSRMSQCLILEHKTCQSCLFRLRHYSAQRLQDLRSKQSENEQIPTHTLKVKSLSFRAWPFRTILLISSEQGLKCWHFWSGKWNWNLPNVRPENAVLTVSTRWPFDNVKKNANFEEVSKNVVFQDARHPAPRS